MSSSARVPDATRIENLCIAKFNELPKTGKPLIDKEWTVLSCILQWNSGTDALDVVALGTGTRCIGRDMLSESGDILNDSHAEVMCRRGFLRYIYDQIGKCRDGKSSIFICDSEDGKFELSSNVTYHLFTTHAPCGDASIFKYETTEDDEPAAKKTKIESDSDDTVVGCVLSEDNFTGAKLIPTNFDVPLDLMSQNVGRLRTKPGRGVRTLSMSCSDKLARWNVVGVQGALLHSLLKSPIYLDSIVLGGKQCNVEALERAIWKRWTSAELKLPHTFRIVEPIITKTTDDIKFPHQKSDNLDPAPGSIVWCHVDERPLEVAVNGKKLGVTKKQLNKRTGRLLISKLELFRKYIEVKRDGCDQKCTYLEAKRQYTVYTEAWQTLKEDFFLTWTQKSQDLLKFVPKDD